MEGATKIVFVGILSTDRLKRYRAKSLKMQDCTSNMLGLVSFSLIQGLYPRNSSKLLENYNQYDTNLLKQQIIFNFYQY